MSRRFGRNQRRRMREELAAKSSSIGSLEAARAMDQGLLRYQSEKLDDYKEMLHEVRSMVGQAAVAAGEPAMESYNPHADDDSFQKDVYMPPMSLSGYKDFSMET